MTLDLTQPIVKRNPKHGEQHIRYTFRQHCPLSDRIIVAPNTGTAMEYEETVSMEDLKNL